MKGFRVLPAIYCLLILTTLTSCGSSGGPTASGGVGGTGISQGPITNFGSVFVNGVEFSTTGTVIKENGSSSDESKLRIGMVVTVQGMFDANGTTGTADKIDFNDNLEGPIQSIDTMNQNLMVMGQTVIVDSGTKYNSDVNNVTVAGLNDLQTGNVIEVSGLPQADGTILATYIELKSPVYTSGMEIEVKGMISGLDTMAETFKVVISSSSPSSLIVNYSAVAPENLPFGGLSDGMFVEVKSTAGFDLNSNLIASKVESLGASVSGGEGTQVELEGFVTRFASTTDFDVNGHPVSTTVATIYENGTANDLTLPNSRVEVEGRLDANGVLIANKISFDD